MIRLKIGGMLYMSTIELKNRKYSLIEEIMGIENDAIIEKIEKLIAREKKSAKSPIAYTIEEIKLEVAEAEQETGIYSQDEVKAMSWKK